MPLNHARFAAGAVVLIGAAALLLGAGPVGAQGGTDIFLIPLTPTGRSITLGDPVNITSRPGYDNQPAFTPDGLSVLFTSTRANAQADIFRYDIATRTTTRLTNTPESEYSPTVMPGGSRFSVIRVEADSTQRLWSFAIDGTDPRLVLEEVRGVGYHAWADDTTVAVFVLGNPATLRIANIRSGAARTVVGGIGRSLAHIPGTASLSFVRRDGDGFVIERHDPARDATTPIGRAVAGGEYVAWLPTGAIAMASGSAVFVARVASVGAQGAGTLDWQRVGSYSAPGPQGLTRIAISADGRWLALVGTDPAQSR